MPKILKKWGLYLPTGIVLLISVALLLINCTKTEFFEANLIDIVTIAIAGIITWYLTEKQEDDRRRNDCIEHIIVEIEGMILSEEIFSKEKKITLLKQSSCANRIKYLKDANFQEIREDIEFISSQFEMLRNLYSEHMDDPSVVEADFRKIQSRIGDKCNKIRLGLYC